MDLKIIPVLQVFIAAVMMVVLTLLFPSLHYNVMGKNLITVIVLSIAMLIAVLAVYCFRQHDTTVNPKNPEDTNQVVNSGIYAYSRNPMYLAFFSS